MKFKLTDCEITVTRGKETFSGWARLDKNCVHVTHLPTGYRQTSCDRRGDHQNRAAAIELLKVFVERLTVPKITRVWYPKSQRHYWCVSQMPRPRYRHNQLWEQAHAWCNEMNKRINPHKPKSNRELYR